MEKEVVFPFVLDSDNAAIVVRADSVILPIDDSDCLSLH